MNQYWCFSEIVPQFRLCCKAECMGHFDATPRGSPYDFIKMGFIEAAKICFLCFSFMLSGSSDKPSYSNFVNFYRRSISVLLGLGAAYLRIRLCCKQCVGCRCSTRSFSLPVQLTIRSITCEFSLKIHMK